MDEKALEIFSSFLPEALVERITSDPYHLDRIAEQRWVTILFADITGFTPLCERLSPEEVMTLLDNLFRRLVSSVRKYGGVVDKFLGDAVMALFGAPVSHSDDPQRAIRAALEMVEQVRRFNRTAAARRAGARISISIGINSGFVISGLVGDEVHREYTAIGDAVNIAARLEEYAKPWEIIVGQETFERARWNFRFEQIDGVMLKGKSEPQKVWLVKGIGASSEISPAERKFFRDERTERFIDDSISERVQAGIAGDPTALDYWRRFIQEKAKSVVIAQPIEGRGFSVVESIIGGLPRSSGRDESARRRYIEQLRRAVEKEISERVLVILQAALADEGSVEVLSGIKGVPVFWLGESIPARVRRTFRLKPLSRNEARRRIRDYFRVGAVSKSTLDRVLSITQGEVGHLWRVVRFVDERGFWRLKRGALTLPMEIELPADLSAYAAAYLDSLPVEVRDATMSAAVLGMVFPESVLKQMVGGEVVGTLPQEIFHIDDGGVVRFRWALFQQAAYSMLSAQTRRRLHRAAAGAYRRVALMSKVQLQPELVGKYGVRRARKSSEEERLAAVAPELGYHYEKCGRWRNAFRFLLIAGEQQKNRWAYREAIGYLSRAESIGMRMLPRWKNVVQIADLLFTKGELHWNLGEFDEAIAASKKAARLAVKFGDKSLLYGALMRIAVVFSHTGRMAHAEKLYERALSLLNELPPNPHRQLQLMINIGVVRSNQNKLSEARSIFLKALRLARSIEKLDDVSSLLTNLCWIYQRLGRARRAARLSKLAVEIDRRTGNILAEAQDLVNYAIALNDIGETDEAIASLRRSEELFRKLEDPLGLAFALNCIGEFSRNSRGAQEALKLHRRALRMAKQAGDPFLLADILRNIGADFIALGDSSRAMNYLRRAQRAAQKCGDEECLRKIQKIMTGVKDSDNAA